MASFKYWFNVTGIRHKNYECCEEKTAANKNDSTYSYLKKEEKKNKTKNEK